MIYWPCSLGHFNLRYLSCNVILLRNKRICSNLSTFSVLPKPPNPFTHSVVLSCSFLLFSSGVLQSRTKRLQCKQLQLQPLAMHEHVKAFDVIFTRTGISLYVHVRVDEVLQKWWLFKIFVIFIARRFPLKIVFLFD